MNEDIAFPLVSIVLATYNGEKFLEKQLESLFLQTYPNIEIIAVDDRSSDNTVRILQAHAARHPAMKVFVNETNLGFIKNFQKGCSLAGGAFIACCDQDDYWHADKISKLAAAIGHHPMIYCDSVLCDQDLRDTGRKVSDQVICRSFNSCLQQAVFCRIYGHATLIKSAVVQKAMPFLEVIPHDWWLSFISVLHGEIQYLPEPLVLYRQHSANLFGVVGLKSAKKDRNDKARKKARELYEIRRRINAFRDACPAEKEHEKKLLNQLAASYRNFSLLNNTRRMFFFLRYRELLLASKRRSGLKKLLFCFKMFIKIK